jgi:hypothetical protein
VKKGDAPFTEAAEGEGGGIDVLDGEELTVVAKPAQWKEALAAVQAELRSALANGFAPSELDEVRKNELRNLDEAVKSEKTRSSEEYVGELLAAAESRVVPTDAAVERDLLQKPIEQLTSRRCVNKLRVAWTTGKPRDRRDRRPRPRRGRKKQARGRLEGGQREGGGARAEEKAAAWGYASDPAKAGKSPRATTRPTSTSTRSRSRTACACS